MTVKTIEFAAVVAIPHGKKRVHWACTDLMYWSRCGTIGETLCGRWQELGTVSTVGSRKWCKECEQELIKEFRERKLV